MKLEPRFESAACDRVYVRGPNLQHARTQTLRSIRREDNLMVLADLADGIQVNRMSCEGIDPRCAEKSRTRRNRTGQFPADRRPGVVFS